MLGCVTPVGEQGADIARTAVLDAEWARDVRRRHAEPLLRIGPREREPRRRQGEERLAEDLVVAGGVESMSRWTMGSDGGAWVMDPRINAKTGFVPQGIGADLIATMEGFSRTDVDTFALTSHKRAAAARAEGRFARAVVPVKDIAGLMLLDRDETIRDSASLRGDGQAGPQLRHARPDGLRRHRAAQVHHRGEDQPRAPRRQLERHRRRRRADAGGQCRRAARRPA